MESATNEREDLYVPDRFEGLRGVGTEALRSIIVPVPSSLSLLANRFEHIRAARQGGLLILRGETGAGKTTFLNTVGLFLGGVVSERVLREFNPDSAFALLEPTLSPRIIVLEGREALGEVSRNALEALLHNTNSFVRSEAGRLTLVVWPTNTEELTHVLRELATQVGGEALLGVGQPVSDFRGPPPEEFRSIAERTVATLNEGASLAALGISEEQADELAERARTIGQYLALVRNALLENGAHVRRLLPIEQFRLWTVVIAGNDPDGDVAALTRGGSAYADIDRLMTATSANIVKELKKHPDTLGILGSVLDARIVHLDRMTALAIARQFGDDELHAAMKAANMSTAPDARALERLAASELGLIMSGQSLGTRRRGSKPGGGTETAFMSLANIARTSDGALNRAIGRALVEGGYASTADIEKDLGTELSYQSDLYVVRESGPVRLEIMWRSTTGRAEIANYVLMKLGNYGKAIGLLG